MEKIGIDANAFIYPMPVTLIGALVEAKPNFLTVSWVSRINYRPALIAAALGKAHYTNAGIVENKTFSVNVPGQELVRLADYCGLVSGRQSDKSRLFEVFFGTLKNAPMIKECPLCMECRLVKSIDLDTNTLFIGEICAAYSEEKYLTDGKPDVRKIKPFTLTMPDNNYWATGGLIARAWSAGRDIPAKE